MAQAQYRFRRAVEARPEFNDDRVIGYTITLAGKRDTFMPADVFEALFEPDGAGPGADHPGPPPPPTW